MKTKRLLLGNIFHISVSLLLVFQSLFPVLPFLAARAYAQDSALVTPTETPVPPVTVTPEPTATVSPIPTDGLTITPTAEPTAAPTITVSAEPTLAVSPASTVTSTPTTEVMPTLTPTATPTPAVLGSATEETVQVVIVPSLLTNKLDYSPTEIAEITGSGFAPLTSYTLLITADNLSKTFLVTADTSGNLKYNYQLDGIYRPLYKVEVKDLSGTVLATTSFTDSSVNINLDQWANKAGQGWQNGNLNGSNSSYTEGSVVPFRLALEGLSGGQHTIHINYDFTQGGKEAYDFLADYNATESNEGLCEIGGGAVSSMCPTLPTANPTPFPSDSFKPGSPTDTSLIVSGAESFAGKNRHLNIYGGSITNISDPAHSGSTSGDSSADLAVTFDTGTCTNNCPVLFAWGGHLGESAYWKTTTGGPNGAGQITGSSFHMRTQNLDGSGNKNQDRSIQKTAIITLLTVKKILSPSTDSGLFNLLINNTNYAANIGNNGSTGTREVSGGNNSVSETAGTNTSLLSYTTSYSCSDSFGNSITDGSTTSFTVNVLPGTSVICTFTNTLQQGTLIVSKHVVNDNGGTKTAADFNLHVKTGSTDVSGSPAAGSEDGISYTLNAGSYAVSENTPPSGYTQTGFSGDCDSTGSVSVVAGQSKTCTITNDDQAAHLIVIKHVDNGATGATNTAADFTMAINTVTASGGNSFAGSESPGVNKTLTTVGTYSVTETGPSGYSESDSADCSGTIALGETKTCTITNTAIAPQLKLIKTVVNNNGGTKQVSDFILKIDSNSVTSGDFNPVTVGSHTASEVELAGYTASVWGGDCAGNGTVSLALGQTKTCTITNDDNAPALHLRKTVTNDNGGTADSTDWTLSASGPTPLSGTTPVDSNSAFSAGTYSLSESGPSGYSTAGWNCTGDATNTGDSITLGLGQSATCTINNDDIAPKLHLRKIIVNDNGGLATLEDFTLTANGTGSNDISGTSPVDSGATLKADTFVLSEGNPGGYTASNWVCVGGTQNGSNIALGINEEATCTITNDDQAPHLIIIKHVINDNGGTKSAADFSTTITGVTTANPTAAGVESPGVDNILTSVGSYSIDEGAHDGYTKTLSADCLGTIALGETKTCTITNDDIAPKLHLRKTVITDNGGKATAANFTLTADGSGTNDLSGTSPVDSGSTLKADTFALSETSLAGYSASTWNCTGGTQNGSNITLDINEEATCTIINDDINPSLTLVKIVNNNHGGKAQINDWTLTATGPSSFSGQSGVTKASDLRVGTYTLSESGPNGYSASDWVCTGNGIQSGNQISLDLGQSAVCTIINSDIAPRLTIIKHVINDNGGTAVAGNFTMNVTATNPSQASFAGAENPGTSITLNAGSYSVDESNFSGYTKSLSTDCSGTIAIGQTKTCTITNDDIGPTLTITKVADPKDCEDFAFSGSSPLGNFSLDDDLGVADCASDNLLNSQTFSNLSTNHTYTINETEPNQYWTNQGIACVDNKNNSASYPATVNGTSLSVSLPLAGDVTCTFTNHKTSPTRTLGFWKTHTDYTTMILTTKFNSLSPLYVGVKVAPTTSTHRGIISDRGQLFGAYYSNISKTSTGGKRSKIDQARIQLLWQLITAKLNCAAFGCGSAVQTMITSADVAYATGDVTQMNSLSGQLDTYNNSGDTIIPPGLGSPGKAAPNLSQQYANLIFWNTP